MTNTAKSEVPVPVICVAPSSFAAADMFNPNFWAGGSKGLIQSCWTEYSVLHYCAGQISDMCNDADRLCAKNIETIQQQWRAAKFDLGRVVFYSQQPDLHIRIEAFFSGVKTLLDLVVQLLSTEKVVSGPIDGFHRTKDVFGGKVLNALRNNALQKEAAARFEALISEHKELWIDRAILARDRLIHPEKGMHQLMFHLELAEDANSLVCVKVHPPAVDSKPIHQYAEDVLRQITTFSPAFLGLLREIGVSNNGPEPAR